MQEFTCAHHWKTMALFLISVLLFCFFKKNKNLHLRELSLFFLCDFYFRSSTLPQVDEVSDASVEPQNEQIAAVQPARRVSTLGVITEDAGMHVIKRPEHGGISTAEQGDIERDSGRPRSRKLSRDMRWQSIRKRTNKKRESTELQIRNVHRIAEQHHEEQRHSLLTSRFRSFSVPVTEERTSNATRRILSCGDDTAESRISNVLDLAAVKSKREREESSNSYRDTSL